jgi:hypothetical protein
MSVYGAGVYGAGVYGLTPPAGALGSTTPVAWVEMALFTDPGVPPSWIDVSDYVQGYSFHRGRSSELDRVEAATGQVLLDNRDRRFDPTYTAGPYYGYLVPTRRVRGGVTYNGTRYPLFAGYVEDWQIAYPGPLDSDVEIAWSDGFKVLALADLNTSFPQEPVSTRIKNVLDLIGWGTGESWTLDSPTLSILGVSTILGPVGDRLIGGSNSDVQGVTLTNVAALQHLQDVMAVENGLLFMDANGSVAFQGRHRRLLPPYNQSQAIFGDDLAGGELPYVSLEPVYNDSQIWNDVRLTRVGGTTQVAADAVSRGRHFLRTFAQTNLLTTSDVEVADQASWTLIHQKDAHLRFRRIELDGEGNPSALWPQIFGRELGDRITVRRRPPGGGTLIEQASFVEAIDLSFDARGGVWQAAWQLSAADTVAYWILDDPAASQLSVTTRLVY